MTDQTRDMPPRAPRVSVLMTTYNRAAYLPAAIESVLAQTFTDLELILVDDGSRDASVGIARSYADLDSRVRVHVNERNLGDYANRNHAASLARGEYLRYADSDDVQYPHCLAVIVPMMDAAPEALVALGGGHAWPGGPVPMLLSPRECYQREFLGSGMFQIGPGGALLRRKPFLAAGGFRIEEGIGTVSDYLSWLTLLSTHSALLVPADLFWYRTHAGQEMSGSGHAFDHARLGRYVWDALSSSACPLERSEREQARRNVAGRIAKQVMADVRNGQLKLARARVSASGLGAADWLRYARIPIRHVDAGTAGQ